VLSFAYITAIAHFQNPQLALFSFTLYTPQEYNPIDSITTFISTHKSYQNLVPAILTEGEDRVEISDNIASAPPRRHLANATLFMLARNSDVDSAVNSVREVEDRFNHKYGYPWVFLNEEAFSDDFKRCASSLPLPLAVFLSCSLSILTWLSVTPTVVC
jgi:alpha 1,2-mannosyltransferase